MTMKNSQSPSLSNRHQEILELLNNMSNDSTNDESLNDEKYRSTPGTLLLNEDTSDIQGTTIESQEDAGTQATWCSPDESIQQMNQEAYYERQNKKQFEKEVKYYFGVQR